MSIEKEKQMNILYSFTPNLKTSNHRRKISTEFIERLKEYDNTKSERLKKIKEEAEKIPDYPIKKNKRSQSVNKTADNSNLNLSIDIVEYQKKKKEKLKKMEQSILIEQGITFKPKLNESVNININSSLIERSREFMRNKSEKLKTYRTINDSECTFSPKVNNNSFKNNSINEDNNRVGDRLFNYQNIYRNNLENRKENLKEYHTFKPDINPNTDDILKQRKLMLKEIKEKYDIKSSIKNKNDEVSISENLDKYESQNINEIFVESNDNSRSNSNMNDDKGYMSERIKSVSNLNNNYRMTNTKIPNENLVNIKVIPNKPSPGQSISDSRLMEMANHFITTDESLELFQARMREKYSKFNINKSNQIISVDKMKRDKSKNVRNYNRIPQYGKNKSNVEEKKTLQAENLTTAKNKENKTFINVDEALRYYNMLDN